MKNIFYGAVGSFSLLAFYMLIMTVLSKSFLAGVSIFLSQYQIPILVISLFINLLGIFLMLKHLHKSRPVIPAVWTSRWKILIKL